MDIESLLHSQALFLNGSKDDWNSSSAPRLNLNPRGFSFRHQDLPNHPALYHRQQHQQHQQQHQQQQQQQQQHQQQQKLQDPSRLIQIQNHLNKLKVAAARVEEAIGIMTGFDSDSRPHKHCNDTNEEDSLPPPPTVLKRKRSDSPTGAAMSTTFFQEDYLDSFGLNPSSPMVPLLDDGEESAALVEQIINNSSNGIEPLPLLTSVSRDLSDLLNQYLPKTTLTFFDKGLLGDDEDAEEENRDHSSSSSSFPFKKRKLLPEFKLMIEENGEESSQEVNPFVLDLQKSKERPAASTNDARPRTKTKTRRKRSTTTAELLKKTSKPEASQDGTTTNITTHKKTSSHSEKTLEKVKEIARERITREIKDLTVRRVRSENQRTMEDTWNVNYRQLLAFHKKHGHSNVLRSDADTKLSGWVKRQRNNLKDSKLSRSQIERLDALDFVWNRLEAAWLNKYVQLAKFSQEYGHCEIPSSNNRSLAEWVQRQRREYRRKGPSLNPRRIAKLEDVAGWYWGVRNGKNSSKNKRGKRSRKQSDKETTDSANNESSVQKVSVSRNNSDDSDDDDDDDEQEFLNVTKSAAKRFRDDYVAPDTAVSSFLVI